MKTNVGGADRAFRLVIGLVLVMLALAAPVSPFWRAAIVLAAVLALVSAVLRYCPVNALFGLNTNGPHDRCPPDRSKV